MRESDGTGKDLPENAGEQAPEKAENEDRPNTADKPPVREIGGPEGPEPTRYGDWERNGRCTDF